MDIAGPLAVFLQLKSQGLPDGAVQRAVEDALHSHSFNSAQPGQEQTQPSPEELKSQYPSWGAALEALEVAVYDETNPVLQPTIKMLTSSESIGRPQKVSKLLAIVTNIRTSCSGNILVKLRDPTGEIQGDIRPDALAAHPGALRTGVTLLATQATFMPVLGAGWVLNITRNNLTQVFTAPKGNHPQRLRAPLLQIINQQQQQQPQQQQDGVNVVNTSSLGSALRGAGGAQGGRVGIPGAQAGRLAGQVLPSAQTGDGGRNLLQALEEQDGSSSQPFNSLFAPLQANQQQRQPTGNTLAASPVLAPGARGTAAGQGSSKKLLGETLQGNQLFTRSPSPAAAGFGTSGNPVPGTPQPSPAATTQPPLAAVAAGSTPGESTLARLKRLAQEKALQATPAAAPTPGRSGTGTPAGAQSVPHPSPTPSPAPAAALPGESAMARLKRLGKEAAAGGTPKVAAPGGRVTTGDAAAASAPAVVSTVPSRAAPQPDVASGASPAVGSALARLKGTGRGPDSDSRVPSVPALQQQRNALPEPPPGSLGCNRSCPTPAGAAAVQSVAATPSPPVLATQDNSQAVPATQVPCTQGVFNANGAGGQGYEDDADESDQLFGLLGVPSQQQVRHGTAGPPAQASQQSRPAGSMSGNKGPAARNEPTVAGDEACLAKRARIDGRPPALPTPGAAAPAPPPGHYMAPRAAPAGAPGLLPPARPGFGQIHLHAPQYGMKASVACSSGVPAPGGRAPDRLGNGGGGGGVVGILQRSGMQTVASTAAMFSGATAGKAGAPVGGMLGQDQGHRQGLLRPRVKPRARQQAEDDDNDITL